jgi:hypothetical protein
MHKALAPIFCVGVLLWTAPALGQECTPSNANSRVPTAARAMEQWESYRRIQLTDDAKAVLLSEFCNSATELVNNGFASRADISSVAPSAIRTYLDQTASSSPSVNTMSYTLGSYVLLNAGPAIPGPRALGRISITYNRSVDSLIVAGTRVAPYPVLMSAIGTVRISGLRASATVCSGQVVVSPSAVVNFTC